MFLINDILLEKSIIEGMIINNKIDKNFSIRINILFYWLFFMILISLYAFSMPRNIISLSLTHIFEYFYNYPHITYLLIIYLFFYFFVFSKSILYEVKFICSFLIAYISTYLLILTKVSIITDYIVLLFYEYLLKYQFIIQLVICIVFSDYLSAIITKFFIKHEINEMEIKEKEKNKINTNNGNLRSFNSFQFIHYNNINYANNKDQKLKNYLY